MADEIKTDIGDGADGVAAGKDIRQANPHQQANPQQSANPSQSMSFYAPSEGSRDWLVGLVNKHEMQIPDLQLRLDGLPDQFARLVIKVDGQDEKSNAQVKRIESLEINVGDRHYVLNSPVSPVLTRKEILFWALIGFLVIVIMVGYLIYLQAARGG